MSSSPLISVRGVVRSFTTRKSSVPVLRGVDLDVFEGEIVALTGASGVGKSTLLHLMGGLDRPTGGDILFRDRSLGALSEAELAEYRNKSIGFVFQFHHLLPEFSAQENVAMPLMIRGISKKDALSQASKLLDAVELSHRNHHIPGELSGGEQQRVALARSMVTNPSLILADEPTGNLDEETGKNVFDVILRLNQDFRVSFVVATHNMDIAESVHRWLRVTDGRVEEVRRDEVAVLTV